jgi:hypothetical protein
VKRSPPCLSARARRTLALLSLSLGCSPAPAVFTGFPLGNPRFIELQVGASGGVVNTVRFNISGANIGPQPSPVPGLPDAQTPSTTPGGGVRVRMRGQWNAVSNNTLTLVVNSAAGMVCVAGTGCGSTVIPFTTVSWVSYQKATNVPGFDIQDGTFSGGVVQPLGGIVCCTTPSTVEMSNTLVFSYDNATLYPAGQYRGRVVFTAVLE